HRRDGRRRRRGRRGRVRRSLRARGGALRRGTGALRCPVQHLRARPRRGHDGAAGAGPAARARVRSARQPRGRVPATHRKDVARMSVESHTVRREGARFPVDIVSALRVWQRNLWVYRDRWFYGLLPNFFEPVFYLLGMGVGLGYYVTTGGEFGQG